MNLNALVDTLIIYLAVCCDHGQFKLTIALQAGRILRAAKSASNPVSNPPNSPAGLLLTQPLLLEYQSLLLCSLQPPRRIP